MGRNGCGQHAYEQQYQERVIAQLERQAHAFGFTLMRMRKNLWSLHRR
jgi:hypothetical protein